MNQSLPKTRKEARELGVKHCFTGKQCKHGHVAAMKVSNYTCTACEAARRRGCALKINPAALKAAEVAEKARIALGMQGFPKTAHEALELGAKHYFTGKPCKHGHLDKRLTSNRECCFCMRVRTARILADRGAGYQREYRKRHPERARANTRRYTKKNPGMAAARKAARKAAILDRTPAWANLEAIKEIYQRCPEGHQVDHVIPLQGTKVSGLHVAANLQHLTQSENASKGNRYVPQVEFFHDRSRVAARADHEN